MEQTRWQKIEQIFYEAIALPPDERERFVAEKCGDDDGLCREIVGLLVEDSENPDFLNTPVFEDGLRLIEHDFADLVETAELARYKLLKLLGRGGMGAVFLARDSVLERDVALKILPPRFAENAPSLERFRQEARAASAVSHPNAAHIYEFGEAGGRYFLAMEYVAGKTLRELLQENAIDRSRAINIALQIADALTAMHRRGIIHRDIKPENIIINENNLVKILDFGLAKFNAPPAENALASLETTPGLIVGTTAYMSPEQVRAQTLDARTDLWSTGVVLFEMLTGKRPFAGETPSDIQAAILLKDISVTDLPAGIDLIISKLLKKNLTERYQTAEDLTKDLRDLKPDVGNFSGGSRLKSVFADGEIKTPKFRAGYLKFVLALVAFLVITVPAIYFFGGWAMFQQAKTTPVVPVLKPASLAVLPFQTEAGGEDFRLLSEGLAEDLTRGLGSVVPSPVIAYSSAKKMREASNDEIKTRLDVETVLRGRIEPSEREISVAVELVNLHNGAVLWSEKLNAEAGDLLKLRNALAQTIAAEFQKINGGSRLVLTDYGTRSNEAFRLYLEGKYAPDRATEQGTRRAVEKLKRAVALDSNYALAHVALAEAYNLLGTWFNTDSKFYQPLAKQTAEKAIAIDGGLSEAHTILAKIKMDYDRDFAGAENEFKRAVELNPNNALAHHWYGEVYLSAMGRLDESLRELETARRLNPLSAGVLTALAWTFIGRKEYEKAVAMCEAAMQINPDDTSIYSYKSMALMKFGKYDEAIETIQKAYEMNESGLTELGVIYGLSGQTEKARQTLEKLKKEQVSPYNLAVVYAALGEKDTAFQLLDKQAAMKSVDLLSMRIDPLLDTLRDDARFAELEKKMNLPNTQSN